MKTAYFWKNDEVVKASIESWKLIEAAGVFGCYSVEPGSDDPEDQYGIFGADHSWQACSIDELPAEFRAHLLLLGVS